MAQFKVTKTRYSRGDDQEDTVTLVKAPSAEQAAKKVMGEGKGPYYVWAEVWHGWAISEKAITRTHAVIEGADDWSLRVEPA